MSTPTETEDGQERGRRTRRMDVKSKDSTTPPDRSLNVWKTPSNPRENPQYLSRAIVNRSPRESHTENKEHRQQTIGLKPRSRDQVLEYPHRTMVREKRLLPNAHDLTYHFTFVPSLVERVPNEHQGIGQASVRTMNKCPVVPQHIMLPHAIAIAGRVIGTLSHK